MVVRMTQVVRTRMLRTLEARRDESQALTSRSAGLEDTPAVLLGLMARYACRAQRSFAQLGFRWTIRPAGSVSPVLKVFPVFVRAFGHFQQLLAPHQVMNGWHGHLVSRS